MKSVLQAVMAFILSGVLVLIGFLFLLVSFVVESTGHPMSTWIWAIPLGAGLVLGLSTAGWIWYRKHGDRIWPWSSKWQYSAKISPPPYGGRGSKVEIRRER